MTDIIYPVNRGSAMKVSREQMAENRGRILDAAATMVRQRGFEGVTVADVMRAAGLTHGGFYGHFQSKDDLLAQACAHAARQTDKPEMALRDYAEFYLGDGHRKDRSGGCPLAAVAGEAVRQTPEARAALASGLADIVAGLSPSAPGDDPAERRRTAMGCFATMLGGIVLSRLVGDGELSDEVIGAARRMIEDRVGPTADRAPPPSGT